MKKLSVSEEIAVWSSIRNSINAWEGFLVTLLTSGTALFFIAFGVILANASHLGNEATILLAFGLFLGTLGFSVTVYHLSKVLEITIEDSMEIETTLFGKGDNPRSITKNINYPVWLMGKPIEYYSKFWVFGLSFAALLLTAWRILIWAKLV